MTPHALIAPARLAGASLMRAQSDERLVDLVRAGNEAAFEAIVARHRRPLQRYCARFLSESRAEDAVQQSFLSAYNSLRSSSGDMNLRPWLYRISHNTSLNMLRERGTSYEQLSEEIDGVERPDQAAERSERLREVVSAVSSLPARQRDAILLREMEGRSYEEIAVELGVSGGAVRQLLSRARSTLRAGTSALTPYGLAARVPWSAGSDQTVADRIGNLCTAGAGGALATKACATVLVTGAVVGGVAGVPPGDPGGDAAAREHSSPALRAAPGPVSARAITQARAAEDATNHPGAGRRNGKADRQGDGDEDLGGAERRSGARGVEHRGHGDSRGDERPDPGDRDSSGPGSDDRAEAPRGGDSGPSLSSGSGSSGSGSTESGSSGSESSGSGSTESGSSGSGSSGSGSSWSGSGSADSSGSSSGSSVSGSGADDALSGLND